MPDKLRTFLDAGVLIAAARGEGEQHLRAMALLESTDREFVASDFLGLEVMPKPLYNKRSAESEFYTVFFNLIAVEEIAVGGFIDEAFDEALKHGLSAIDALHVIAAAKLGAVELVTTEKPTKPMYRTTLVRVVPL